MNNDTDVTKTLKADTVVIGGGGAGLAAAVAAAEGGSDVILIEKRGVLGGNSVSAEGIFAAGSPVQKRMNIDADKDRLFQKVMNRDLLKLDAAIMRAFINKSGDTISWLESKGINFECIRYYPNQVPLVFHCFVGGGPEYMKAMKKNLEHLQVRTLLQTGVKDLITKANGRIGGVIAQKAGKPIKIISKSVVIATGGYGGNKKLLKKYCSFYAEDIRCYGLPHTGDGLLMAMEKGAATADLGILHMGGPDYIGSAKIRSLPWEPNLVWVNRLGERFIDENIGLVPFGYAGALLRQPGHACYALFDEQIKNDLMNKGVIKGRGTRVPPQTKLTYLDEELQSGIKSGAAKKANSWTEIAKFIGAKPQILKATVQEYNSCSDKEYDATFGKDPRYLNALRSPPFYAIKCSVGFLQTIGGIKINRNMEVLDKEYDVIPGLYAAGSDTAGWSSDVYSLEMSGAALGFAINSGRIAGENALKFNTKR